MMRTRSGLAGVALLGLTLAPRGAPAETPKSAPAETPKSAIDPQAVAALERMGAFLRTLKTMRVDAETTTDDVLDSGQKVKYSGMAQLKARRPDRLRIDVASDRKNEQIYYDGHSFTIFQPRTSYYATFDAPPTLDQLVTVAEQKYGLDLPLADLFYWGTERSGIRDIRSATRIGVSNVKGSECDHWAFHEADVDWELFIQRDGPPLPRKVVVTTITERTQPQYTAVLTWDLSPKLDEHMFSFTPPAGAKRIEFETAAEARRASTPASR
jgi:hypothetical protein